MSVSSEVQIYNLALNAIGERSNISAPTDKSRGAEVCRLWYGLVKDSILSAAFWPEAQKITYLGLVNTRDSDTWAEDNARPGYTYAYALPSDMLRPRYMTDYSRFLVGTIAGQRVLSSNLQQAALVYTERLDDVSAMGAELQMALVYGLAANICMPITGKRSRALDLRNEANELITTARVSAANTSNEQQESLPDWIIARGYSGTTQSDRYFYPYGNLLSIGAQ